MTVIEEGEVVLRKIIRYCPVFLNEKGILSEGIAYVSILNSVTGKGLARLT